MSLVLNYFKSTFLKTAFAFASLKYSCQPDGFCLALPSVVVSSENNENIDCPYLPPGASLAEVFSEGRVTDFYLYLVVCKKSKSSILTKLDRGISNCKEIQRQRVV